MAITGKNGDAKISSTQILETQEWSFKAEVNILEYASNATAGIKKKLSGNKSASGTLKGVYDPFNPVWAGSATIKEDQSATLTLQLYSSHSITVPALIKDIEVTVNIDDSSIENWSSNFEATAAWTYPSAIAPLMAMEGLDLPQPAVVQELNAAGGLSEEAKRFIRDAIADAFKQFSLPVAAPTEAVAL